MSSVRVPRYSNASRSIRLNNALSRIARLNRKVRRDHLTGSPADNRDSGITGHITQNNDDSQLKLSGVYEPGLFSSRRSEQKCMKIGNHEYHTRCLGYSWRFLWRLNCNGRVPQTMIFAIRCLYPFDFKYQLVFRASFKRNDVVIIEKEYIFKAALDWQEFVFDFNELDGSFYMLSWPDMKLEVFGQVSVRDIRDIWNDLGTERNFLSEDCPHDRVLVIDNRRFYILAGYIAMWSRFFNHMFFHSDLFKDQKEIVINDVDVDEFFDLLQIIYPDRACTVNGNTYESLLKLADRFEMPRVLKLCQDYLHDLKRGYFFSVAERNKVLEQYNLPRIMDLNSCSRSNTEAAKFSSSIESALEPNVIESELANTLTSIQLKDEEEWW